MSSDSPDSPLSFDQRAPSSAEPSPLSWTGVLESPPGAEVVIDGRRYLYFAGTAYLALQGHPAVIAGGCEALQRYGVGTATSRGGYGASPPVLEVERLAARLFDAEAAFYYISGYWGANLTLAALQGEFDFVCYDEHSHYSLVEAVRLSGVPAVAFAHRDAGDLRAKWQTSLSAGRRPLVLSDGVFASSGRVAPIDAYRDALSDCPGSILMIDDAHAVGVLGQGRGTFAHFGFAFDQVNRTASEQPNASGPRLYHCGTLSKAIGGSGGIIAGSRDWIARVKAASSYFNAASAPAAPVAGATAAALRLVLSEPELRERLQANTRTLRAGLKQLGLPVDDAPTPFLSLVVNDAAHMQKMQRTLRERGLIVAYAAAYSGVGREGHLRLAVSAAHTESMIHRLIAEIGSLC